MLKGENLLHSSVRTQFRKLPTNVQHAAARREKIFRKDPLDPRLRTHKLKGNLADYWSFSVTHRERIVFKFLQGRREAVFHQVGDHDIYK